MNFEQHGTKFLWQVDGNRTAAQEKIIVLASMAAYLHRGEVVGYYITMEVIWSCVVHGNQGLLSCQLCFGRGRLLRGEKNSPILQLNAQMSSQGVC